MSYYCEKCKKEHDENYHRHKKYSRDRDKEVIMPKNIEETLLLEKRLAWLEEQVQKIHDLLYQWHFYMKRHVQNYMEFPL